MRYQGQGQVITPRITFGVYLLVSALDAWRQNNSMVGRDLAKYLGKTHKYEFNAPITEHK